ncbi:MAG: ATP-binding protein [Gemmatimonadaceae bacterium]
MLGPAKDALEDGNTAPENRQRMEVIYRNALRLLKLVNTMLDFTRIEAGRVQASYVQTELAGHTAELTSNFRSAMERAGLELVVDTRQVEDERGTFVDLDMWEIIVLNLLSNAFKHTFEGRVSVHLRTVGDHVELAVSDTGVGISEEELPRIFERFHRAAHTRSRTHDGTGIGLALMQELVRLHGGDIRLESAVGVGTTFVVTIPLGQRHLPAERINQAPATERHAPAGGAVSAYVAEALRWLPDASEQLASNGSGADRRVGDHGASSLALGSLVEEHDATTMEQRSDISGARILVADDNADMRSYVARILGALDLVVVTAADGQAALESALAHPPDLIVSDVMMPGLDGFQLIERLAEERSTRDVPVILLSARAGEEARVEGLRGGAADYLVKPFLARELAARVEVQLARSQVGMEWNGDALRRNTSGCWRWWRASAACCNACFRRRPPPSPHCMGPITSLSPPTSTTWISSGVLSSSDGPSATPSPTWATRAS